MATFTITIRDQGGGGVGVTATCLPAEGDPVGLPSPAEIAAEWALDMLQVKDPDRRTIIRLIAAGHVKEGSVGK